MYSVIFTIMIWAFFLFCLSFILNWQLIVAIFLFLIFLVWVIVPFTEEWIKRVDKNSGWDVSKVAKNTIPTHIEEIHDA